MKIKHTDAPTGFDDTTNKKERWLAIFGAATALACANSAVDVDPIERVRAAASLADACSDADLINAPDEPEYVVLTPDGLRRAKIG